MASFHFETSFWSPKQPEQPLPDFTTGFQVLHRKLNQSKVENDEIIQFFKDRIAVEEQYASRLGQTRTLRSSGFDSDDGATLKSCFQLLKQSNLQQSEQHNALTNSLTTTVLQPLVQFQDDYKLRVNTSRQALESSIRQLDSLAKEAERAKQVYHRRCREANLAEEQALNKVATTVNNNTQASTSPTSSEQSNTENSIKTNSNDSDSGTGNSDNHSSSASGSGESIQLGNQVLTRMKYDQLIQEMHQSIPMQDYRVPILGKYQNTSTGENIARWLQQHLPQCKDSPAMADVVGQQLIQPYGVLRLVGQRGNKFIASPSSFYQWRGMATTVGDDENNSVSATGGPLNLGGFFERKTATSSISGEEPHKRARSEAERADEAYQTAIKRVDQMRMVIEESLFAHFAEMEQVEIQRINTIKQAFTEYTSSLSTCLPVDKSMIEELIANQESLKPDQDIQYIVQQYYVGGYSPKPILYENFYHGIAHDQIFGVPLTELAKHGAEKVPTFVKRLLDAIEEGSKDIDSEKKKTLWSTRVPLDQVHSLRTDINISTDRVTMELLLQHDAGLLVALLRLYFLELPQCLFTFELYDAAHALYSNSGQDTSLLLLPVSNLIASLPAPHFETLRLLMEHVNRYVKENDVPEETITIISQSLASVLVRSNRESLTTMTSRIPTQLTYDMIKHYNDIFSDTTLKAHADSEKRRQARPLIVNEATDYATSDPTGKKRGGLMSFMRASVEDPKWSLGVFKGNNNQQESQHTTPTTNAKHTFTPSTITHESPPLLPQKDIILPPPTEVMFDVADHVTRKPKDSTTTTTDAILDDIDADNDDLDPFFDDD
ncbi:hypothetical protein BC941DRAFT_470989 [Chlamydoabsidia padenii]|nr:hypothetical protein BC941DRAFT_470989 [Chlamydoabsidia padenii]